MAYPNIAIVIGRTAETVAAKAEALGITYLVDDIKPFSSVTTQYALDYAKSGDIETNTRGFILIAKIS